VIKSETAGGILRVLFLILLKIYHFIMWDSAGLFLPYSKNFL